MKIFGLMVVKNEVDIVPHTLQDHDYSIHIVKMHKTEIGGADLMPTRFT